MQEVQVVQTVLPEHIQEVQDKEHLQHVRLDIIVLDMQIEQRVE